MMDKANEIKDLQLRYKIITKSKSTLGGVIVLLAIMLLVLPFWLSLSDIFTRGIMRIGWYREIQEVVVPYELRVIGSFFNLLKLPIQHSSSYFQWVRSDGKTEVVYLIWNCIGWQTVVFFLITLFSGLSGKHKLESKMEVFLIGVLGTYLVNIFRLTLVVLVYFVAGRPFGVVFHDYFSTLLSLGWLFFFWWFSYSYILETKENIVQEGNVKV